MTNEFDPFERLRDPDTSAIGTPDVGTIKQRAKRIERRRATTITGAAIVVALIAVGGFVMRPGNDARDLAGPQTQPTPTSAPLAADIKAAPDTSAKRSKTVGESGASALAPAAGQTTSGSAPAMDTGAAPAATLTATIEIEERDVGRGAELTLRVCNETSTEQVRKFSDAQRYDFVVTRDNEEQWRWSQGRVFAQVTGEERWKPKACKTWTGEWDGIRSSDGAIAPPGNYEAHSALMSDPPQKTKKRPFCLDVC